MVRLTPPDISGLSTYEVYELLERWGKRFDRCTKCGGWFTKGSLTFAGEGLDGNRKYCERCLSGPIRRFIHEELHLLNEGLWD